MKLRSNRQIREVADKLDDLRLADVDEVEMGQMPDGDVVIRQVGGSTVTFVETTGKVVER